MQDNNRDLIFVDAVLPNGTHVKVAAQMGDAAQDVAFTQPFNMDNLQSSLSGFAQLVSDAVAKVAPDTVQLEFGFNLCVEGGKLISLLTSVSSEASLTVRLAWNRQNETNVPATTTPTRPIPEN
jgi:hypothetical protein